MTVGGSMSNRSRNYELMFIISPLRTSDEEVTTTIQCISQQVTNLGGEVLDMKHSAPWGRRKLAYPIRAYAEGEASRRTFTEGYYVLGHFSLPTSKIVDFERPLKLNDTVLRYMLTLVDVHGQPVEDTVSDDQELEPDFEDNEE